MSFHVTIIEGNMGRDPETRHAASGDAICNFSVAVSEKYKDNERTTWYRVTAFGKQAEIAQKYLQKGSPVLIQGRMQEDKWTDKSGVERTSMTLRCDQLRLIGGKNQSSGDEPQQTRQAPAQSNASGFDDFEDTPF